VNMHHPPQKGLFEESNHLEAIFDDSL